MIIEVDPIIGDFEDSGSQQYVKNSMTVSKQKEKIPPLNYARVLQELSEDESDDPSDIASDCDETEQIEYSVHDSASEIEDERPKSPLILSSPITPSSSLHLPTSPRSSADAEDGLYDPGEGTDSEVDDSSGDPNIFIKTIYKKKKVRGKIEKEISEIHKWNKTPLKSKFSRTHTKNILPTILPHAKNCADVENELSAFQKIVDSSMIDILVNNTNLYLQRNRVNCDAKKNLKRSLFDTNRAEMLAFIGILYLLGTIKMRKTNLKEAWASDGTGIEILQGIMGLKRFRNLSSAIRLDDKDTRKTRQKTDKLAAIREFYNLFNSNCQSFYTPGDQLTIDEKLEPFRGRCSFIQYIPNKPAKYGLKYFAVVDSHTFYTLKVELYCGKQHSGPYEVSNSPYDIVQRLIVAYEGSHRNLTTDSWYTSYPLSKYLLSKGITLVGTMERNKKEIPQEFLPSNKRAVGGALFGFQKDVVLVSYATKKNKCVILLSTAHDDNSIDQDTNKPNIILDYNKYKYGVDVVDQLGGNYTVAQKTNRWPMSAFYSMLNVAGINAQVLLNLSSPDSSPKFRRYFLRNLAVSLMKPHLQNRVKMRYLPLHSRAIIRRLLPMGDSTQDDGEPPAKKPKGRGRCHECGRSKNNHTTITCTQCGKFTCKNHLANIEQICTNCVNGEEELTDSSYEE